MAGIKVVFCEFMIGYGVSYWFTSDYSEIARLNDSCLTFSLSNLCYDLVFSGPFFVSVYYLEVDILI